VKLDDDALGVLLRTRGPEMSDERGPLLLDSVGGDAVPVGISLRSRDEELTR
jgi:hypothetical protein